MPVTGDFSKLRLLIGSLERMTTSRARADLNKQVGAEALSLVQQGFEQSKAPDGSGWLPLKVREGQPLLDTGRLRNSLHAASDERAATVETDVAYAAAQNYGATIRHPARVNAHGKAGSFISRNRAGRLKRGSVRISFSKGGASTIPPRPFLPSGGLSPEWSRHISQTVDAWVRESLP